MRAFLERHLHLIGYLFLVGVAVLAVELHHDSTTRGLNRIDERSCAQRNRLAENQRAVLNAVRAILVMEIDESEHVGQRAEFTNLLHDIQRRLLRSGPEAC